ncbi:rab proteins geranylgeranyltransferase component A 1 [Harmonia axyridis]|uniref:rab proteins geranylgeranyltransferase component A 1 n=1 Tax=Harmonia axyridis TaxID=115357 RepID=UPI001E278AA7|nr:rab proteins geranylgeranyltransferase component A 1 [Harmonia axyridis]
MDNNLPTEFDLIVVGTGVVESIISAAASRVGKRVLHLDNKSYYGGHWASFNLEDFQNLRINDAVPADKDLQPSLGDAGEVFKIFGNELSNIRNLEAKWHVEKTLPKDLDASKDKSQEDEELQKNEDKPEKDSAVEEEKGGTSEEIKEKKLEKKEPTYSTQESLMKDSRKFIIDLCPKLHFARGVFVELLISSNIARYSEFRSVSRVLTWINGNLEVVPCSRSDVFANNRVTVVEKRMLMKLLTSIEGDEKNSTVPPETTYKSFLKGKKLSDNIIHFVLYALSMSTDATLWLDGLRGTKRFLQSLGRFGKTPFLFSMYGSGEVAQAFCRLSAVFGGIFALNQPLHGFLINPENVFQGLICGDQKITAPHMVLNMGLIPLCFLENTEANLISRAVLITNKSLMDCEREELTLLLYPLKNNKLCRILELGTLTGTCPKNLFLVHITAPGLSSPKEDLQECIEKLFTTDSNTECQKPKIIWSAYFSIPDTNNQAVKSSLPKNVYACPGPDSDLDYDYSVQKAKEIFSAIYPGEDFLPRAPDAEEIVIEGEEIAMEGEPEPAAEAGVSSNNETNTVEVEVGSEQLGEGSSDAEVAEEAKDSNAGLNERENEDTDKKVEECSEVNEITK